MEDKGIFFLAGRPPKKPRNSFLKPISFNLFHCFVFQKFNFGENALVQKSGPRKMSLPKKSEKLEEFNALRKGKIRGDTPFFDHMNAAFFLLLGWGHFAVREARCRKARSKSSRMATAAATSAVEAEESRTIE
jgi:hypothetical protein